MWNIWLIKKLIKNVGTAGAVQGPDTATWYNFLQMWCRQDASQLARNLVTLVWFGVNQACCVLALQCGGLVLLRLSPRLCSSDCNQRLLSWCSYSVGPPPHFLSLCGGSSFLWRSSAPANLRTLLKEAGRVFRSGFLMHLRSLFEVDAAGILLPY